MKRSYRELSTRLPTWPVILVASLSATALLFSSGCSAPKPPPGGLWTKETLSEALVRGESPRAILVLDEDAVLPRSLRLPSAGRGQERLDTAQAKVAAYARTKEDLLAHVPSLTVIHRYEQLPVLAVTIQSQAGADALFSRHDLAHIHREEFLTSDALESQPLTLISQPVAQGRGYVGSGTSVAVLDTGVDFTKEAFGSCSAAGLPTTCKVAYAADFAPNDAQLDDASEHGSNVAGIVLAVAPEAKILALDVFNKSQASSLDIINAINWVVANQGRYNIAAINMSLGTRDAYSAACDGRSVFAAAIAAARNVGVLTVVASGNSGFANMINNPGCVSSAVSVGAVYDSDIGPFAADQTCTDEMTAADQVACFSNSAPFLTMLAPGVKIAAADRVRTGTSQAAPHVAGAIAVLRAAFPTNSTDETVSRLTGGGPLITDPRNGVSKPRLDLDTATQSCFHVISARSQVVPPEGGSFSVTLDDTSLSGCGWSAISNAAWITLTSVPSGAGDATISFTVPANEGGPRTSSLTIGGRSLAVTQLSDRLPPTGTVKILGDVQVGTTRFVQNKNVLLQLTATDPSGVSQMCISNRATCLNWEPFATSPNWTLMPGSGSKTVSVWYRDTLGNTTPLPVTDTLVLDDTPPSAVDITASGSTGQVVLNWTASTDSLSGFAGYRLVATRGYLPSPTCAFDEVIYDGMNTTFTHGGLTDGATYYYRVCPYDGAGNYSPGSTVTARPAPEYIPPTGSVSVDLPTYGGKKYTVALTINLLLTASDESGVTQMCISNTPSCPRDRWQDFSTSTSWDLAAPPNETLRTVYVWFGDSYGNRNTTPFTDKIFVDRTAPSLPTVRTSGSSGQIVITWTPSVDTASGVRDYRLLEIEGTAPPSNCASGTEIYNGTGTSFARMGLPDGVTYSYRVCSYDNVGNASGGGTGSGRAAPEYDVPTGLGVNITGGVQIGNTRWVGDPNVQLALSATDPSGVQMCLSNTSGSCATWVPFAPTASWLLQGGTGAKTVYAFFKDTYNNVAPAPVTDSIWLDQTPPVDNGTAAVATGSSTQVDLSWGNASDPHSGVGSYKVVYKIGSSPANCADGTAIYTGAGTLFTHVGLTDGTTYNYRICAVDRMNNVSTGLTVSGRPAPEYDPPEAGAVTVLNTVTAGSNRFVGTSATTLAITAMDQAMVEMCVSNTPACTAWEPLSSTRAWALINGTGPKTVYVFFRDIFGNVAALPATDTVILDQGVPTNIPSLLATGGNGQVDLSWSAGTDAHSGVGGYKVVFASNVVPTSCTLGTLVHEGPELNFTHTGLVNGTTYYYRVCTVDSVGNLSTGVTASARTAEEYDPPADGRVTVNGTVSNNGQKYVGVIAVSLAISVTDLNGIQMCVSNTAACTAWEAFVPTKNWSLPGGAGSKTVYVFFRDSFGNVAPTPATDTVILDVTPPGEVTGLAASGSDAQVNLNWLPSSDANAGMGGYKVAFNPSSTPANCNTGVIYQGPDTTFTHNGPTNGATAYYRVCAYDGVNNTSAGASVTAKPAPEYDPPTNGSVAVHNAVGVGGVNYIATQTVTLDIAATDLNAMQMCVSNSTTCTAWETYKTTKSWGLTSGAGVKQVYVLFRDVYNNLNTTPATTTVTYDPTAPSEASGLTATGGDTSVTLAWTAATDSSSGIGAYKIVYSTTAAPAANCQNGLVAYSGPETSFTHSGLTNGTVYYYRVCTLDNVSNTTAGLTVSARPAPEYDPPATGTVYINNTVAAGQGRFISTPNTTLSITAMDQSTMQMCVSNTNACTAWEAYSATRNWALTGGTGAKTVYVFFRDIYNNLAPAPATDTVTLDQTLPSDVSGLTATGSDQTVTLNWTAATDATSGVGGYKVVESTTGNPGNCNGTLVYNGTATSFVHTGLVNGSVHYYRVCAYDNVNNTSSGLLASARAAPEYDPPTLGSVSVNGTVTVGASRFIGTTSVQLAISATDVSPMQMCVSSTNTCNNWEALSPTKNWPLTSGTGAKTVYVFFRDIYGNVAPSPATDTVTLDQTAPGDPSGVTTTGASGEITLNWSAGTDSNSGVGGAKIVYSTVSAPTNCATGTLIYSGPGTSYTHTGLANGTVYYYRVCTLDNVNNVSTGVTASDRPAPEYDPPAAGTVVVNGTVTSGGTRYIGVTAVTLAITATDQSAIQMCVSNTTTCTAWENFSASKNWALPSGTGVKSVRVFFRDIYNNVAAAPAIDTVTLDQSVPSEVSGFTAVGSAQTVSLSWTAATDANSGVGAYKIISSTVGTPANCTTGNVVYSGPATTFDHIGLVDGSTYYYRVCVLDNVNNMSAGVVANARPAPEYNPPTAGSVFVNNTVNVGQNRYIGTTNRTLTISAIDESMAQMCVSATTTCTTWETLATSRSWSFAGGTGTKTVYVFFRDVYNNVAPAPATDTVTLDQTLPTDASGLTAVGSATSVALNWTAGTDATSGIGGYKIVYSTASAPAASCTNGTTAYTGTDTSFTHSGLTDGTTYFYRLCALDNVGNISAGVTANARPASEYDAPTGTSVIVNGTSTDGTKRYIGATAMTLALTATDQSSVQMCVSNTNSCTAWETFSATKSWSLTGGTGVKTVYAFFRDVFGNVTAAPATDTVTLDQTLPTNPSGLLATGAAAEVSLSWAAGSDADSGVGGYKVVFATTGTSPANCATGAVAYTGSSTSFVHSGLANGTTYSYRVCTYDGVNNISAGVITSARPAPEYDPPVGTVFITNGVVNGGTRYVGNTTVTLAITGTDQSAMQMCVSNSTTCTAWETFSTTKSWVLAGGAGAKTVYLSLRDIYGNVVAAPATDTVTLDQTVPTEASGLVASGASGSVTLNWNAATDASSGIGGYKLVYAANSSPVNCSSGTVAYTGSATTFTHTGLTNGTLYGYRLCSVDLVNNISTGVITSARPAPEFDPPVGSVTVLGTTTVGGTKYIATTVASLMLTATDANPISMCVSNTATCTSFETFVGTKTWSLAAGSGVKTVYVTLRDSFNNTATAVTDVVTLDQTVPTDGTATATGSDAQVALSWTGFADAHSGVASYKVMSSTVSAPPASCATGSKVYEGTVPSFTHAALTNGTTYFYRVCAIDSVGNVSAGVATAGRPAPEYDPPTGIVTIADGSSYATSVNVSLSLSATDVSGVTQMCVSNTSTCTTWESYATTKNWVLTSGSGDRTVFVWFKDAYGNATPSPATATVLLDSVPPIAFTVTANGGPQSVVLSWTDSFDQTAGLSHYTVQSRTDFMPVDCVDGSRLYAGNDLTYTATGLTSGTTSYFRVCAWDLAGNVASVTTSAQAQ